MKRYQVAIAMTVPLYKQLKNKQEGRFLRRLRVKTKITRNLKDKYAIITGEWIGLHQDDWTDLLRQIESKRHAILTISDEGEIWRDVNTDDDEGCDEVFNEILGWTANICLWGDPCQIIV